MGYYCTTLQTIMRHNGPSACNLDLAVLDVLSLIVYLPLSYWYIINVSWYLGITMCKVLLAARDVTVGVKSSQWCHSVAVLPPSHSTKTGVSVASQKGRQQPCLFLWVGLSSGFGPCKLPHSHSRFLAPLCL